MNGLSPQQLDPLGGVTAQTFSWVLTTAAFGTAIGLSIVHSTEYHDPLLLAVAFGLLGVAGVVAVLSSSPRRAPFGRRSAVAIHLAGLGAVIAEAAAQWGTNEVVRSDWAPLSLALLVVLTGCFRPAAEILVFTGVSVAVVASVTMAGAAASQLPFPLPVYAGLTAGPVLAAGAGAAAFSAALVSRLLRWHEATGAMRLADAESIRARVREDVHVARLALVEAEVGPFLRELLDRGSTVEADAVRARTLGEALRRALVAEADEVWLGDLVTQLHDPGDLAGRMDEAQRAAVEAACVALTDRQTLASLARVAGTARLTLRWGRGGGGRLGPEVQAMLRHVFPGARLALGARVIELEFEAD